MKNVFQVIFNQMNEKDFRECLIYIFGIDKNIKYIEGEYNLLKKKIDLLIEDEFITIIEVKWDGSDKLNVIANIDLKKYNEK